jgi:uncharacterized protein YbjQ (UPF0145 family)
MILTTTPGVEGRSVRSYHGIVVGESQIEFDKESFTYTKEELAKARNVALDELGRVASEKGADAVVSIDLDYVVFQDTPIVTVSGTAVKLG